MSHYKKEPRGVSGGMSGPGGEAEKWHPKQPETYKTWIGPSGPERPYVVGDKPPSVADVTLVKAPPPVRQEIYREILAEKVGASHAPHFYERAGRLYVISGQLSGQAQELAQRAYEIKTRPPPPSLAERLLEFGKTEPLLQVKGVITGGPPRIVYEPVKPFAGVAGFMAYPETLAYAGMTWFGKEPPTRPPPSPFEVKGEYGLGYATATVWTSILFGEATSKVFQKFVTPKAQTWLTKQYLAKGPAEWKGLPEKFVMKVTGAKPYLAQQVVSIPTPEIMSYASLKGEAAGWLLAETPRSSALLISKMPGETLAKAWVQEHLFKAATGGLSYALVEKELAKTLEPRMPYIPKVSPFGVSGPTFASSILFQLFGFGVAAGAKTLPSVYPTFKLKPTPTAKPKLKGISKPKLFESQMPYVGQVPFLEQPTKQKAVPLLALKTGLIQGLQTKQIQKTALIQRQMQYQPPYPAPPKTMLRPPRYPPFDLPRKRRRKRGKKDDVFGLYGRYPRIYPVATAKQFLKMVIG